MSLEHLAEPMIHRTGSLEATAWDILGGIRRKRLVWGEIDNYLGITTSRVEGKLYSVQIDEGKYIAGYVGCDEANYDEWFDVGECEGYDHGKALCQAHADKEWQDLAEVAE